MSLHVQEHPDNAPDDYLVLHGKLMVGRVYKRSATTQPEVLWIWALNGMTGLPSDLAIAGTAATREEALAAVNEKWTKWLEWANLKEAS
jgi:hypothetical protein